MIKKNGLILLEHTDFSYGDVYEESLLLGGVGGIINNMELNESTEHGVTVLKFRGKFQEADAVNKNKRQYPFAVLESNVKKLNKTISEGGLIGELDHPSDSIVHFKEASHKIVKLWWEDKNLMGEGVILGTPCGRILRSLINDGVRIGISSRGVGNGKVNEDGILVIGESYKLITFDAVADPSTYSAFQQKVNSTKSENYSEKIETKNEGSGIYNLPQDLLKNITLNCFNGVVRDKLDKIKQSLK